MTLEWLQKAGNAKATLMIKYKHQNKTVSIVIRHLDLFIYLFIQWLQQKTEVIDYNRNTQ